MFVCMCVCVCVHVYVCAYMCKYFTHTHTHTHTHTNSYYVYIRTGPKCQARTDAKAARFAARSCSSTKTQHKMTASFLKYFAGEDLKSSSSFGVCMTTFGIPDIGNIVKTVETDGKTTVTVNALSSYDGALPGITDQPSIVFAFPPPAASLYTWPLESERRVQWASFNLPKNDKISLKLLKNKVPLAGAELLDLSNDMSASMSVPSTVPVGPGYSIELCVTSGQCWSSDKFSVKAKIVNQAKPVEHEQIMPGDATKLVEGSEAYGLFVSGVQLSMAQTLGVETYRIEIYGLRGIRVKSRRAETRRAATGVKVLMKIHADDTERDTTSSQDLVTEMKKPENQQAMVSQATSFMTSAQTSDSSVTSLTGAEYSDVSTMQAIQEACDKVHILKSQLCSDFIQERH